jgi:hypothetical protein
MRISFKSLLILSIASLIALSLGCKAKPVPPVEYTQPELSYLLLSQFDNVFWCDPDFYPVARSGQEEQNAVQQFSSIRADEAEFSAIVEHLGLPDKAEYTDAEKLQIYREYKKLKYGVQLTPAGNAYAFTLRVDEGQGERIEGTITSSGAIKVLKREPSFNTCPICLIKGTLIDTPGGQIAIEDLREGMTVWTLDGMGRRTTGVVVKTASTTISSSFLVVRVTLDDSRTVAASPGHPTADGRVLGDYQAGDILDGASVVTVEYEVYRGSATYDFLPSGTTGLYWANHILLKSTLAAN